MKQKRLIAAALLLSLTLCGCGSAADSVAENSTEPIETTTSAAEESTTPAVQITTAEGQTTAADTASASAETTTAEAIRFPTEPFSVQELLERGETVPLRCSGSVYTMAYDSDGTDLFETPGGDTEPIAHLADGRELEVTGICVTGALWNWTDRWLMVKIDGLTGYVLADDILVQCTWRASQMTEEERAALGAVLYYQSMTQYLLFQRWGGTIADGFTGDYSLEGFDRLKPDGLTVAQLRDAFHMFFTDDFPDDFDECYREEDGALWVITGYGDNIALDYTVPYQLTEQSDERLVFDTKSHWYIEIADTEWEYYPFEIVYADGLWRTAVMTELY